MPQPPLSPPPVGTRLWDYVRYPPDSPNADYSRAMLHAPIHWMITAQECFRQDAVRTFIETGVRQIAVLAADMPDARPVAVGNGLAASKDHTKSLFVDVSAVDAADAAVSEHFDTSMPVAYVAVGTLESLPDDEFARLLAQLGACVTARRYLAIAHVTTADPIATLAKHEDLASGLHPRSFDALARAVTESPYTSTALDPTTSWDYLPAERRPADGVPDFCWVGYADPPIA